MDKPQLAHMLDFARKAECPVCGIHAGVRRRKFVEHGYGKPCVATDQELLDLTPEGVGVLEEGAV